MRSRPVAHFEAMVFTALAEELRTGDVAVVGSEEYADWPEQLLAWEALQEGLGSHLVEVRPRRAGRERRVRREVLPPTAGGPAAQCRRGGGRRVPGGR
uniref:Uncharacterized protein n=1 Tax=Streptomyces sp. NBC_01401 TaxID=2903854 RepID=A0AAU3H525_9ACTN